MRGLRSSTPRHLREALALIASGAVECESLVDCVLGLDAFDDGLARYLRPRGAQGGVRTVIAARYWAPRDVRVEHVAEPEPRAGEVVLRIEAALTCGTDAKCYRRGHPVLLGPAPAPFGHEYAGVVVACGEDAPFAEGDLVCGVNSAPCGIVPRPARPAARSCAPISIRCSTAPTRELLRVPARIARVNLHRVPEGVAPEIAAAIEPLACAVHGADDADVRPGQRIAILGRGPLGRLLALACEARGATAELLGRGEGEPRSYETVIEAAGTPEAWEQAIALAAPGRHRRALRRPAARDGRARRQLPPALRGAHAARLLPSPPARRARGARPARARGVVDRARCSRTSSRSPTSSSRSAAARASRRATGCSRR